MSRPKILVLTVPHGAAHQRLALTLQRMLLHLRPGLAVEVLDALDHCTGWFRAYYNSYAIPLKYCPALWGWIEGMQHTHQSTGPGWLYRRGAEPLFRLIQASNPDVVIATEVGMCELAAILKREKRMDFRLVAVPTGADVDRPWVQPEVDLYVVEPREAAPSLEAWGAPRPKLLACGFPVDPPAKTLLERTLLQANLGITPGSPTLLVLFGGTGIGNPDRMIAGLEKVRVPFQTIWIAGRNEKLRRQLEQRLDGRPNSRVYGWVNNMQEWMRAADLLLGKTGSGTVFEAINSGLPLLAFDPLPGLERRTCAMIEKWKVGYWVKRPEDLAPIIERLFGHPEELLQLRNHALAMARPEAAREAARAILNLLPVCNSAEKTEPMLNKEKNLAG